MMDGEKAENSVPEVCSTPRSITHNTSEAFVSQIDAMDIRKDSPADSEESEADVLERSIRFSSGLNQSNDETAVEYKIQQLTNEIEPTTMFSGSIMHTAESPTQINIDPAYFQTFNKDFSQAHHPEMPLSNHFSASNNEKQFPSNQVTYNSSLQDTTDGLSQNTDSKEINRQPSAPTLQQIQSRSSVPLMDVSRFHPPLTGNISKPSSHIGQRPSASGSYVYQAPDPIPVVQSEKSVESQIDNTQNSPQESMNISLSPITSPNTSLLLKPSVHWYYSNPGGSWNPFSYRDSEKLEKAYTTRMPTGYYLTNSNKKQLIPPF